MNPDLREAIEAFVYRLSASGLRGYHAEPEEVQALQQELGNKLPLWYAELLTVYPLCGVVLQSPTEYADYGLVQGAELFWSDPALIRLESLGAHPGNLLLAHGYLCIAGCMVGSGDPYCIRVQDGNNPPVYSFNHEAGLDADSLIAYDRTLLWDKLSDLFSNAHPVAASQGPGMEPIYKEDLA